jgi:purine-binding chemotaxis protein CheW
VIGKKGKETKTAPQEEITQLAVFSLGNERYAIDIYLIKEIIRPLKITSLPGAPSFIEGVVNLRGDVIPVIDMRKRFEMPPRESGEGRMIIVKVENQWVGILVDTVTEVIRIPRKDIKPPPKVVGGVGAKYLQGVCKHKDELVILLNLDQILTSEEKIILRELKSTM